jgi:hypothetical protein
VSRRVLVFAAACGLTLAMALGTGCQADSLIPETAPWPSAIAAGTDGAQPPLLRPIPLPSPTFSPWIAPAPSRPPARFAPVWADTPIGEEPPGFTDPATAADRPAWLHSGHWPIAGAPDGQGVVWQSQEEAPQPFLSFRVREARDLPERYVLTAAVTPVSSPHFQPPVGEIALIPHYEDATHYVEVVLAADRLSIWVADGGQPGNAKGWRGIKFLPLPTGIGQTRTVRMTVDRTVGSLQVDSEGTSATISEDALRAVPAGVAVRASGNRFAIDEFRIEAAPGG